MLYIVCSFGEPSTPVPAGVAGSTRVPVPYAPRAFFIASLLLGRNELIKQITSHNWLIQVSPRLTAVIYRPVLVGVHSGFLWSEERCGLSLTEAQTFFVASPSGKLTCLLGPPPSSSPLPLLSADLLYSSCDHIFRTKNEDRTCLINTNYGAMQQTRRKRTHARKYGTSGRGHGAHTTSLSSPPRRVLTAGMTCHVPLLPPVG